MPPEATASVALLGPTNTGKTHQAVERMLEHSSGMIGLPLRLLAREIYDRVSMRVGQDRVALVTGEEKRVPRHADYWVCTTEAMPVTREVDFVAIDEVQLAAHDERGHVFTERLLHARGRRESWFLGAGTMRPLLERLVPAARQLEHPRLSRLSFAGSSKLQRLPARSALVAFSVPELYELAHRLRALRGGAAVVLGALSPRARNAQVAMFQAGEVDYLVATDAIGMGLNLDVGHVAFASLRKFDGKSARNLDDAELAQIAGRAGRYLQDGTFGTLSPSELPLESARRIEQHRFEAVRRVRYRNADLDFSSPKALLQSLTAPPPAPYFAAVPGAVDLSLLSTLLSDARILREAANPEALELLWAVCQVPDFRHILFEVHLELVRGLFGALQDGPLSNDFLASQTQEFARDDGGVDTLVARISRLRTWAFVVHHAGWCHEPALWAARLNDLEDELSDALHRGLVATFVERHGKKRTTKLRSAHRAPSLGEEPSVDRHHPFAALKALRGRVHDFALAEPPPPGLADLVDAPHSAFDLDAEGRVLAGGVVLGRLIRGANLVEPNVQLSSSNVSGKGLRLRLERRLLAYARDSVGRLLGRLLELERSDRPALRAIAYQLARNLGTASANELRASLEQLDDTANAALRAAGVEVGILSVFMPSLLELGALGERATLVRVFEPGLGLPPLGRSQYEVRSIPPATWRCLGYLALGPRACRVDLAERAVSAIDNGASQAEALRSLSLPRRDVPRVVRAMQHESARARPSAGLTS